VDWSIEWRSAKSRALKNLQYLAAVALLVFFGLAGLLKLSLAVDGFNSEPRFSPAVLTTIQVGEAVTVLTWLALLAAVTMTRIRCRPLRWHAAIAAGIILWCIGVIAFGNWVEAHDLTPPGQVFSGSRPGNWRPVVAILGDS
jgi:uncharacterized membrane protein YhaH (DUF805 family)